VGVGRNQPPRRVFSLFSKCGRSRGLRLCSMPLLNALDSSAILRRLLLEAGGVPTHSIAGNFVTGFVVGLF